MSPGQKGNRSKDGQQKREKVDCCTVLGVRASGTAFACSVLLPCSLLGFFVCLFLKGLLISFYIYHVHIGT